MKSKKIDTRLDSLPLGRGLTATNTYVFARRVCHYPVKWWIYRREIPFHAFELRGEKLFSVVKKWRRQEGEPLSRRRQTQSRPNAVDDSSIVSFAPESISLFLSFMSLSSFSSLSGICCRGKIVPSAAAAL